MTSELDSGFGVELEAGEAGSCPAEIWEKWGECVHTQHRNLSPSAAGPLSALAVLLVSVSPARGLVLRLRPLGIFCALNLRRRVVPGRASCVS